MSVRRPALRYHGGKWILAPWIIGHFPRHRVYVEPYGGAGSVLLRKPRSYAEIYNDLDGEIVNVFRILQDDSRAERLRRLLTVTPFSRDEYRMSFAVSEDPVEQARRTIIRSLMGFGSNALARGIQSGFRCNSSRSGTTPALDWMNYPEHISRFVARLRGVVIENRDAIEIISQHDGPHTLHYCDPPYVRSSRSSAMHGDHGYTHEMTDDDHRRLSERLHIVSGFAIVSGYRSPLYESLYGDWAHVERASLADGARERTEVLWLSPRCDVASSLFDLAPVPADNGERIAEGEG